MRRLLCSGKRPIFCCVLAALLLIGCGGGGDGATAFTLKIDANPNAGGTVSPSGDIKYSAGTKAEVTATAADGYRFIGWSGASTDKAKSITVAMSSDQALTANFEKAQVITDSRDGKKYRTVKIGKLTWMAQNLNFGTVNRWCYDNNTSNCAKYGRLYTWNAAMNACPSGWRLPALEDWNELVEAAGGNVAGTKLKASSPDWNGTDEFGFSALPGGYRNTYGSFGGVGSYGGWWSAAEDDGGNAWLRDMSSNYDGVTQRSYGKNRGFSVVCVQN